MANYGQSSVGFVLVGGVDLKGYATDLSPIDKEGLFEQSDTLGDSWVEFLPVGVQKAYFTQNGFYDDASASTNGLFATGTGTERVVCINIEGNAIEKRFIGFQGAFGAKYTRILSRAALHKANVQYVVSGAQEDGVILQELAAKTADWDTEALSADTGFAPKTISANSIANPTVVTTSAAHGFSDGQSVLISGSNSTPSINGAHRVSILSTTTFSIPVNVTVAGTAGTVTASGGGAFQQVTAFSGFTGFVGKVRHSDDDITFADLATFANVTSAPAAERVAVSTSTLVNRYLSFTGDVTGSGSITLMAGFARA